MGEPTRCGGVLADGGEYLGKGSETARSKTLTPIEASSGGVSQVVRPGGVWTSFPMIAEGTPNSAASRAIAVVNAMARPVSSPFSPTL